MVGVTPMAISNASIAEIVEAIKPAGMYNMRSKTLKQVANRVIKLYDGDLTPIVSKPYKEAREALMSLPGVGEKTADFVLLFNAGKPVIPVDRHIARIAQRLELVPRNAAYDKTRLILEETTQPENYLDTHIKLIQFGRDTCKAQNPKCGECILNDICPYPQQQAREQAPVNKQPRSKSENPKQTE
jgi:endonuclease-3